MKILRSLRGKPGIGVAYHEDYVLGFDPTGPDKVLDPLRPAKVRKALDARRWKRRVRWIAPPLATQDQLALIHPQAYLQQASQPGFIGAVLGIDGIQPWETEYWDSLRRITGGTIATVRHALEAGEPAINLSGGFHHAWPQRAAGFCVVNDIAVAIAVLRAEGFGLPVAVVDLDFHHGDGTEACLAADHATWTLSLHVADWNETPKSESMLQLVPKTATDEEYLHLVAQGLGALAGKLSPALVVYVAGADPWAEDKLCDMQISTQAMLRRDLLVARWAQERGAALAVVPAGGYGTESWRLLAAFAQALMRGEHL